VISLDIAASEFYLNGVYQLARDHKQLDSDGFSEIVIDWIDRYPIAAVEDPLAEDDEEGLQRFTQAVGDRIEIVGDDYLFTNAHKITRAAGIGACNAALIKPNQAGTVTETLEALNVAQIAGWPTIMSARSGESEDTSIVHLAVGWGASQLKVGSMARGERTAKWNEAVRIEQSLRESGGPVQGLAHFPWMTTRS